MYITWACFRNDRIVHFKRVLRDADDVTRFVSLQRIVHFKSVLRDADDVTAFCVPPTATVLIKQKPML